jgi:hypothetical protein
VMILLFAAQLLMWMSWRIKCRGRASPFGDLLHSWVQTRKSLRACVEIHFRSLTCQSIIGNRARQVSRRLLKAKDSRNGVFSKQGKRTHASKGYSPCASDLSAIDTTPHHSSTTY